MTITKAHLHDLFARWEELNELIRKADERDMEEWHDGFCALYHIAEGYGLELIAWFHVRSLIDFVDDVNDGLASEERFLLVTQALTQIGVEITEKED